LYSFLEDTMITKTRASLKLQLPTLTHPSVLPRDTQLVNANPHCGPFPFVDIIYELNLEDGHALFQAELSKEFIVAQILPRGRPHFSLLHVALVDDAVAVSSFTVATKRVYGERYRYVELGATAGFHREAFMKNSISSHQFGTCIVDGFRVRWRCVQAKERIPLIQQGIFQVSILGLISGEEVPVASVEGHYLRRLAVTNIVTN